MQAVLKGDKMDDVVRDAVMLGVAAIQPIVTKRTEMTVAALMHGARLDRWRRVALASVKQSRRAVLPEIRMPLTFETLLDEPPSALRLMLVEPRASAEVEPLSVLLKAAGARPMPTLFVGPEGGWTEPEWTAAAAARRPADDAGPRTLRADAVPVAAISVLQFLGTDFRVDQNAGIPDSFHFLILKSCVLTSPSPSVTRAAPARCSSRYAGSNHSPCSAGSTVDQVVLARRQAANPELAGLIRPRGHDLARLRPPQASSRSGTRAP